MDNFRIDVTWEGKQRFFQVLTMAIEQAPGGKVETYFVDEDRGLVLCWTGMDNWRTSNLVPMPKPMKPKEACKFAWTWLNEQNYGPQPDHDGSNGKGWHIFNENWGHVAGRWEAIVAIQPIWAMYGK